MEGQYIVSARKYRPATFDTVVGQDSLVKTLKNAVATGKIAHAYLFCGPRGVGKTTCARIFAKTINCMHPVNGEACNQCESCTSFNEHRSFNIHELDAASNNLVDDIRALNEQVMIPPQTGKYKVFIIDEVHMLTSNAFNAFLKTLEEPPHYAIFILATTEKHKILPTIISRCQVYDFKRMEISDIVGHLANVAQKEGIEYEPQALNVIANKADGGMRDALSIFDQLVSYCNGKLTYHDALTNLNVLDYEYYFKITDTLLAHDYRKALLIYNDILSKGFDGSIFISGLADHLRNLLIAKDASTAAIMDASEDTRQRYKEQAARCSDMFLCKAMKICNDCDFNYKASRNKRLHVELALIITAQIDENGDDPVSGRGPAQVLKPIFNHAASTTENASQQKQQVTQKPQQNEPAPQAKVSISQAQPEKNESKKTPVIGKRIGFSLKTAATESTSAETNEKVQAVCEEKSAYIKEDNSRLTADVSAADMNIAWKSCAMQMPVEDSALSSRMLNMELEKTSGTGFNVVVENEMVRDLLIEKQDYILSFMENKLSSQKITMEISVSETTESKIPVSRSEKYQEMCKTNKYLLELQKAFKLEFE